MCSIKSLTWLNSVSSPCPFPEGWGWNFQSSSHVLGFLVNSSHSETISGPTMSYLLTNSGIVERGWLWKTRHSYHSGNSEGLRVLCQKPGAKTKLYVFFYYTTNIHFVCRVLVLFSLLDFKAYSFSWHHLRSASYIYKRWSWVGLRLKAIVGRVVGRCWGEWWW